MSKSSHFKTHLIFYVVAVSSVLGLFRLTSAYGEANLTAAPNLNGRYVTTETPPGCPENSRLAVTVQQSGIYLNGAAELEPAAAPPPTKPLQPDQLSLHGRWQQQIMLSGRTPAFELCEGNLSTVEIAVQGTVAETPKPTLTGQLILNNSQPWPFSAQRQELPSQESNH